MIQLTEHLIKDIMYLKSEIASVFRKGCRFYKVINRLLTGGG